MVSFEFIINESFINYASHPITVPKRQVDYRRMAAEFRRGERLRAIAPDGRSIMGQLYFGRAGFGTYWQIRTESHEADPFHDLRPGERVRVTVRRAGDIIEAHLSHA